MRSAPAHDSYWPKVGNWLVVKPSYFCSADAIWSVPALGSEKGRNRDRK